MFSTLVEKMRSGYSTLLPYSSMPTWFKIFWLQTNKVIRFGVFVIFSTKVKGRITGMEIKKIRFWEIVVSNCISLSLVFT